MKSVLISIQPKWVNKIASGEKTIEVRKTRPKIETPFKCYIYCTKGENLWLTQKGVKSKTELAGYLLNGKVIGEFVCDRIICSQAYFDSQGKNHLTNIFEEDIKRTCLTEYELWNYIAGKAVKANEMYDGYLWHISDLKIYDKPKELSEFYSAKWDMPCEHKKRGFNMDFCMAYENGSHFCKECICDKKRLTRPPQSWQFIERD